MNLPTKLRDHDGSGHRDGFPCVRCQAATRIEELEALNDILRETAGEYWQQITDLTRRVETAHALLAVNRRLADRLELPDEED